MENTKWHNRFLSVAMLVSEWSKDPSTKVGAIIVKDKLIVSTGYNGFPPNVEDTAERLHNRDAKYPLTVHAELNAILSANQPLKDASIYVTHYPCANCAGAIIQAGISRVFTTKPQAGFQERWLKENENARLMFTEAEVIVREIGEWKSVLVA